MKVSIVPGTQWRRCTMVRPSDLLLTIENQVPNYVREEGLCQWQKIYTHWQDSTVAFNPRNTIFNILSNIYIYLILPLLSVILIVLV